MFWSGDKLKEKLSDVIYLEDGSDPDPKQIDCSAYTLRIGPEFYLSPPDDPKDHQNSKVLLEPGKQFYFPPGQFLFLVTEESVNIPKDAIAFISCKAKYKWRGLVNVSGFHVDPGYKGRLMFSLYNTGPKGISLSRGLEFFLIWFADLDRESSKQYFKSEGKESERRHRPQGQKPYAQTKPRADQNVLLRTMRRLAFNEEGGEVKNRIRLTLPYPPSANELWRSAVTRSKKMPLKPVSFQYETAKSKQYKLHVSGIIMAARLHGIFGPDDRLRAVVYAFPPKLKRKRDVHNLTKCLYDSIAPAMGFDDSQIVDSQVLWGEPHGKQGAVIVYLGKIEDYQPIKLEDA